MIEPSNFIKFLAPLVNFGAPSKKSAGGARPPLAEPFVILLTNPITVGSHGVAHIPEGGGGIFPHSE